MPDRTVSSRRPPLDVRRAILYGGLTVALLDFLFASIYFGVVRGAGFARVWQPVAAGLLGREAAFGGGVATVLLGLGLHVFISFCVAAAYVLASRSWPVLARHAAIGGMVYGMGVHLFMSYVVVPLSALGPPSRRTLAGLVTGLVSHTLVIGLPAALWARRAARPQLAALRPGATLIGGEGEHAAAGGQPAHPHP